MNRVYLFLDFDGVMHPQPYQGNAFCQKPLIEDVLREFQIVQIVISSSWREHYDLSSLKRMFSEDISLRVIGVTKFHRNPALDHPTNPPTDFERQWEIELWMSENASPDAMWIAVDDYPEWFEPDCPNLLVTSAKTGFVENDKQILRDMIQRGVMNRDMQAFDTEHADVLRRLWFLGDVHGEFKHIAGALLDAPEKPSWLVFLGDIDIDHKPFAEILAPLRRNSAEIKVAFIHGNHDADTYEHWQMLHECGDAVALHGQVIDLDGVKVAGLGGNFMGRIWSPPCNPTFRNKKESMNRGPYQWRDGQRPNPSLNAAIYPEDFEHLAKQRADILVTHEAPSCHPYGFEAIDELARSMRVVRSFHGHQHDDRSDQYALVREKLGFDAKAVDYCGIKNGLGHVILSGPKGW